MAGLVRIIRFRPRVINILLYSNKLDRLQRNHQEPVFNLSVQNQPNYFVGSVGLLVHNLKIQDDDDGTLLDDGTVV
jgi:hypothetical protein